MKETLSELTIYVSFGLSEGSSLQYRFFFTAAAAFILYASTASVAHAYRQQRVLRSAGFRGGG
jgi:hypothetical protein